MIAEYVEIETPKQEVKAVTQVHFNADYNINDVLTQWGNWARSDAYLQRKNFCLYKKEEEQRKEFLSDGDALLIDSCMSQMSKVKFKKSQQEVEVLKLYYYGKVTILHDTVMIIPQSLRCIAKVFECSEGNIRKIKDSGESCIIGMLSAQTLLTGVELEVFKNIRVL